MNGRCPSCKRQVAFTLSKIVTDKGERGGVYLGTGDEQVSFHLAQCPGCQDYVLVRAYYDLEYVGDNEYDLVPTGVRAVSLASSRIDALSNIDKELFNILNEAHEAADYGLHYAAGMMFRKSLERIAFLLGETQGKLYHKIEKLHEAGKLSGDLIAIAGSIRLSGNAAAHEWEQLSAQEVADLADYADALAQVLIVLPARLNKNVQAKSDAP